MRMPTIDEALDALREGVKGREQDRLTAAAVRDHLANVREYLEDLHRRTESGRRVNEANSDLPPPSIGPTTVSTSPKLVCMLAFLTRRGR